MRKAMFLMALAILMVSCSPESINDKRDIYLVTVADDFYGYNGSDRKLGNVITDQAAIFMEFQTLGEIHAMCYISQDGKRYTSSSPRYIPLDSDGNELESPEDLSFRRFQYEPKPGESESGWTMEDVMEYMGSIEADKKDLIIFTYSGHGENGSGSLMTNASPTSKEWDAISPEDLLDRLSTLGGKKLVVLDSCFSGTFIPSSIFSSSDKFASGETEDRWIGIDYPGAILSSYKGREEDYYARDDIWVLSATGNAEEASDSLENDEGPFQGCYGAYTFYFLKALGYDMERNVPSRKEERISVFSIYSFIRASFPDYETQIQTPRVSMKGLDLVLK